MVYTTSIASSVDELAASLLISYRARKGSRQLDKSIKIARKVSKLCMTNDERYQYYAVIRLLQRPRFQPHGVARVVLSRSIEFIATKRNRKLPVFRLRIYVAITAAPEMIIRWCQRLSEIIIAPPGLYFLKSSRDLASSACKKSQTALEPPQQDFFLR